MPTVTATEMRQAPLVPAPIIPYYHVHDNGGRVVTVFDFPTPRDQKSYVGIMTGEVQQFNQYESIIMQYDRIFIGEDPKFEPSFSKGNTILLQIAKGTYYYIQGRSSRIFQVVDGEEIQEYESPIGNSDVPYPYALSRTKVYLMIDDACFDRSVLPDGKDPYDFYYDNQRHQAVTKYWPPQTHSSSSSSAAPAVRAAVMSAPVSLEAELEPSESEQ